LSGNVPRQSFAVRRGVMREFAEGLIRWLALQL
jgi:hypothetical protein